MLYNIIVLSILLFSFYRLFFYRVINEFLVIYKLRRDGVYVEGTVIDVEEFVDSDNDKTYKPKVEFWATDGGRYSFFSVHANSIKYKIGQRVRVVYMEDSPDTAMIDSFAEMGLALFRLIVYLAGFGITVFFVMKYLNMILERV